MNKIIKLDKTTPTGAVEIWKKNRKGFFNFIEYATTLNIKDIKRKYKGYAIVDKKNLLKGENNEIQRNTF